jgi:heme-degrading monooxygenase HmoA
LIFLTGIERDRVSVRSGKPRKTKRKEGETMYARVTYLPIKPEKVEEGIELYRKSVVPAAKAQKGFVSLYLLTDRSTGNGMAISFWKTEKDCLANEHNRYYQEQLAKFLDFFSSPPIRDGYEVTVKA